MSEILSKAAIVMRLLYFIRDPYPSHRSDVLTLFGYRLPERGIHSDLVATRRGTVQTTVTQWPPGREYVVTAARGSLGLAMTGVVNDMRALLRHRSYDAIVVRDKVMTAALALLIAPRTAVFFWMSWPFPDEDIERSRVGDCARLRRSLLWLRGQATSFVLYRFVIKRSRRVFVQSDRMREDVATLSGRRDGLIPIPMGIDENALAPIDANPRLYRQGTVFELAYLGSLDRMRRLDFLVEVLGALQRTESTDAFRLKLIGEASKPEEREWLLRRISEMGLSKHVSVIGPLHRDEAWRELATSHVGLNAMPRGGVYDSTSPTKTIEYLAIGLPAVVNDIPDQAAVIDATGAGLCVPMSVTDFVSAILQVRSHYSEFSERTRKARDWVIANRGYQKLADRVTSVLTGE